jgi:hypothetical protein
MNALPRFSILSRRVGNRLISKRDRAFLPYCEGLEGRVVLSQSLSISTWTPIVGLNNKGNKGDRKQRGT